MSSSLRILVVLGFAGLVAACAPPPPEPEPIVVPIVEEEPLSKY